MPKEDKDEDKDEKEEEEKGKERFLKTKIKYKLINFVFLILNQNSFFMEPKNISCAKSDWTLMLVSNESPKSIIQLETHVGKLAI